MWNNIKWGGTYQDKASDGLVGNDKANGAVKLARSMYDGNIETTVKSTLCYGVQWDVALQFIDPTYTEYAKDSTGKGNYTGNIDVTGSQEIYNKKNIYDMGGNLEEWTMEAFDTEFRVVRRSCLFL